MTGTDDVDRGPFPAGPGVENEHDSGTITVELRDAAGVVLCHHIAPLYANVITVRTSQERIAEGFAAVTASVVIRRSEEEGLMGSVEESDDAAP